MQDNKELFDYLKIDEGSKEAQSLSSLIAATDKQIRQNADAPRQQVIEELMHQARLKTQKSNAIKNWFSAFNLKKAAVAAAAVLVMIVAPLTVYKTTQHFEVTEIYSSTEEALFDALDEDLEEIMYIFENI